MIYRLIRFILGLIGLFENLTSSDDILYTYIIPGQFIIYFLMALISPPSLDRYSCSCPDLYKLNISWFLMLIYFKESIQVYLKRKAMSFNCWHTTIFHSQMFRLGLSKINIKSNYNSKGWRSLLWHKIGSECDVTMSQNQIQS